LDDEQLGGLSLAIGRAARKERNLSLAARHLVLSLTEDTTAAVAAAAKLPDLVRTFNFYASPLTPQKVTAKVGPQRRVSYRYGAMAPVCQYRVLKMFFFI
jgi:hypothetical protein